MSIPPVPCRGLCPARDSGTGLSDRREDTCEQASKRRRTGLEAVPGVGRLLPVQEWGQVFRKDLDIQGALQVAAPEAWRAQ